VRTGQPALGTRELDPGHDLVGGAVAPEPRFGGSALRGLRDLFDPGLELGKRALQRVEARSLDASSGPDRERPGGYGR